MIKNSLFMTVPIEANIAAMGTEHPDLFIFVKLIQCSCIRRQNLCSCYFKVFDMLINSERIEECMGKELLIYLHSFIFLCKNSLTILGRKGVICLQVLVHHQVRLRQEQKQELKQGPWTSWLAPHGFRVLLLMWPRSTCPGITPPTVGLASHFNYYSRKCPRDVFKLMGAFSQLRILFPDNSGFVSSWQKTPGTTVFWLFNFDHLLLSPS